MLTTRDKFCDEIDIVEYYGQPSAPRSEFTIHQNGQRDNVGFMVWPAPADPGTHADERRHLPGARQLPVLALVRSQRPDAGQLGTGTAATADVPSRSMNLYVGIWDIGSIGMNVDPPGSFTGDSWMALSAIQVWTDF